eukprot:scaffold1438_cov175-Prasinococcus_capsulatus_cf.AAC.1
MRAARRAGRVLLGRRVPSRGARIPPARVASRCVALRCVALRCAALRCAALSPRPWARACTLGSATVERRHAE